MLGNGNIWPREQLVFNKEPWHPRVLASWQQNLHLTSTFHTETGLPKISVCPDLFPTLPPALLSVCPNTTAPEQTLNLVQGSAYPQSFRRGLGFPQRSMSIYLGTEPVGFISISKINIMLQRLETIGPGKVSPFLWIQQAELAHSIETA